MFLILFFCICQVTASTDIVIKEIPSFLEYLSEEIMTIEIPEFEQFKAHLQGMENIHLHISQLVRNLFMNSTLKMSRIGKMAASDLQHTMWLPEYVKAAITRAKKIVHVDNKVSKYFVKNVLAHRMNIECVFRIHKIVHNYLWDKLYKLAIGCVRLQHHAAKDAVKLFTSRRSILNNRLGKFAKKPAVNYNAAYCRHFDTLSFQSNVNVIFAVIENNCKL